MITVTATEFKARAAKILKEVAATGDPVTVTKRGKPLVRVEKIADVAQRVGARELP